MHIEVQPITSTAMLVSACKVDLYKVGSLWHNILSVEVFGSINKDSNCMQQTYLN